MFFSAIHHRLPCWIFVGKSRPTMRRQNWRLWFFLIKAPESEIEHGSSPWWLDRCTPPKISMTMKKNMNEDVSVSPMKTGDFPLRVYKGKNEQSQFGVVYRFFGLEMFRRHVRKLEFFVKCEIVYTDEPQTIMTSVWVFVSTIAQ